MESQQEARMKKFYLAHGYLARIVARGYLARIGIGTLAAA